MDMVSSSAPKVTPWGTIHGTLWVQMVQPGQQEQLCEGTPGRPPSATFWSCSAQNQQQKGHRSWGLAFKPLKMQQSSEVAKKQQQQAWGASGLAQLCTTCPPRIRFLEFPSLCSNSRPTYMTSCSLSALFMDPTWHTVTKNSFLLYLGKKRCCKIFQFRKSIKWLEGHLVPKVKCTRTGGRSNRAEKCYWRGFQGAL